MSMFIRKFKKETAGVLIHSLLIIALFSQILQLYIVKADSVDNLSEKEMVIFQDPASILVKSDVAAILVSDGAVNKQPLAKTQVKTLKAVITAYTSDPRETDDSPFVAASGKRVYDGMVANNNLLFGTKIKIPSLYGDKVFTVDDRMNPRYGAHRFDIWLNTTHKQAKKFGVKRVTVEIYYPQRMLSKSDVKITVND